MLVAWKYKISTDINKNIDISHVSVQEEVSFFKIILCFRIFINLKVFNINSGYIDVHACVYKIHLCGSFERKGECQHCYIQEWIGVFIFLFGKVNALQLLKIMQTFDYYLCI